MLKERHCRLEVLRGIRTSPELVIDECFLKLTVPSCVRLPNKKACEVFFPRQNHRLVVECFFYVREERVVRRVAPSLLRPLAVKDMSCLCRVVARPASVRLDCVNP